VEEGIGEVGWKVEGGEVVEGESLGRVVQPYPFHAFLFLLFATGGAMGERFCPMRELEKPVQGTACVVDGGPRLFVGCKALGEGGSHGVDGS